MARQAAGPQGRCRCTWAILLLLLAAVAPLARAAGLDPLAAETALFYSDAPALVLTTPQWSLIAPLTEQAYSGKAGLFIHGSDLYIFRTPALLRVRGQGAAGAGR
jgi:hypothetical protein